MPLTTVVALAILVVGGAALVASSAFGFLPAYSQRLGGVVALLAIAVWVGGGVVARYRGHRPSAALMHLAVWLAIAAILAALYKFAPQLGMR